MSSAGKPIEDLAGALRGAYPELEALRAAGTEPVYVVGGAVRDLLLGRGRADLDIVVEGDAAALAAKLGADPVSHERFATAKVAVDGHELDIAAARTESYSASRCPAGGGAGGLDRGGPGAARLQRQRDGDSAAG